MSSGTFFQMKCHMESVHELLLSWGLVALSPQILYLSFPLGWLSDEMM